ENHGYVAGNVWQPLGLPVEIDVPFVPAFTHGTENIVVEQTTTLNPGSYGDLVIDDSVTATLTDGLYHFSNITLNAGAKLEFGAVEIRVTGKVALGTGATFGGPGAAPSYVFVLNTEGATWAFDSEPYSKAIARVFVLDGNLRLGNWSYHKGRFVA